MFADALSAPERKHEQGSVGGVLSGDWNSPYCVSLLEQVLCKVLIKVVCLRRILQKHIKRQIISLNGGFQVIADLNSYYAFITSLERWVYHLFVILIQNRGSLFAILKVREIH